MVKLPAARAGKGGSPNISPAWTSSLLIRLILSLAGENRSGANQRGNTSASGNISGEAMRLPIQIAVLHNGLPAAVIVIAASSSTSAAPAF